MAQNFPSRVASRPDDVAAAAVAAGAIAAVAGATTTAGRAIEVAVSVEAADESADPVVAIFGRDVFGTLSDGLEPGLLLAAVVVRTLVDLDDDTTDSCVVDAGVVDESEVVGLEFAELAESEGEEEDSDAESVKDESELIETDAELADVVGELDVVETGVVASDVATACFDSDLFDAGANPNFVVEDFLDDFVAEDSVDDSFDTGDFVRTDFAGESAEVEVEEVEDVELDESAQAMPQPPAIAAPMPNAAARPPTLPIYAPAPRTFATLFGIFLDCVA